MAKKEAPKSNRKQKVSNALVTVGILLFAVGGMALFNTHWGGDTGTPNLPATDEVVMTDTEKPAETPPTVEAAREYSVAADQPRSVTIKSVGAYGLVQKVGITKDNAMAVPSNIHFAGWYVNSVKPGEPGLSIINGHYSGIYNDAIFVKLAKVKAGDGIEIEFGDKSVKTFEVVEVVTVAENVSAARLFEQKTDITNQLNLITCGGKYDKTNETYSDRVIVVSKLKD